MSNAAKIFKFGETAIRTVRDEDDNVLGTEEVEILGINPEPGIVVVRPFHSEDRVLVWIADLDKVA